MDRDKVMPESQQPIEGQQIMTACITARPCRRVLDVGAGNGRWGQLLKGKVEKITAIEIWLEYVERYGLRNIYDEVIVADAREFNSWGNFDVVILGDVLEHLCREDGLALIKRLKESGVRVYLTVPISPCPQDGTVYGNPYETHLDQWTHRELKLLGWRMLHRGLNPNGRVQVGTYVLNGE